MFELTPFVRRNRVSVYNPFRELEEFEKNFWNTTSSAGDFKTDITETDKSYLLEAELPGFKKEDIKVDIDGDYLTISAERNSEKSEKDKDSNYVRRERYYGSFSRSFDISEIDAENISAAYESGILKLTLPKKDLKVTTARQLEIK